MGATADTGASVAAANSSGGVSAASRDVPSTAGGESP